MDVIIQINGREAIPVRALPWLTRWEFSAEEVAQALARDEGYESFASLESYRLEQGEIHAVHGGEWRNAVTIAIEELAERNLPRDEWERLSMSALPAGVFVWRDEWTAAYNSSPDGPDALAQMGDEADAQDIEDRTLNFSPRVPRDIEVLVTEGFTESGPKKASTGRDPQLKPKTYLTIDRQFASGRQKGAIASITDDIKRSNPDYTSAQIWEALRESALDGIAPFTGVIAGPDDAEAKLGSLCYTDTKNVISWYTRKHLTDYLAKLKRRQ